MFTQFTLALLATTALAATPARPIHARAVSSLQPRQTSTDDTEKAKQCMEVLLPLLEDKPDLPEDLAVLQEDSILTATGTENLACGYTTAIPESLSSDWNSYQSAISSWMDGKKDAISSAVSNCASGLESSYLPCITEGAIPGSTEKDESGAGSLAGRGIVVGAVAVAAFVGGAALL